MSRTALSLALLVPLSAAAGPVARVLVEDPPLPGEPLDGWEPLSRRRAPSPEAVLELDAALALLLEQHPALRIAASQVDAATGAARAARALPNPTWELGLLERTDGHAESLVAVRGELDITDLLLAPVRAHAAAPLPALARLEEEAEVVRLGHALRAAYHDHQAATAGWEAALRSVDGLAASRDTARAIAGAGNAPTRDLLARELAYEEARIGAAARELEVVSTRERLARLLGVTPGPLAPLTPAPETLALPTDLEDTAVAASLELRVLDAALRSARRQAALRRLEGAAPDLDLFVEGERHGDGWASVTGVEITVPLWSFGAGAARIARADAEGLAARRDLVERDVRSAAREAGARLESAHRRALHHQTVLVPARDAMLTETLLHYNAMQLGIDPLLDAWRARVDAEAALADALRELWTARSAVDALLAGVRVDAPRAATLTPTATETGEH